MSAPKKQGGGRAFALCALIGAALWGLVMITRGGFSALDQTAFYHILCDAFFVPAVVLGGLGLLVVVSNGGAFDALHYGVQKLFSMMRSEAKRAAMPKTYFDFVAQRHSGKARAPRALLTVGAVFLAAAGVALALYFRAGGLAN